MSNSNRRKSRPPFSHRRPVKSLISARMFEKMSASIGPCELESGEVIPMSPCGLPHSEITATVTLLLGTWARRYGAGRVFTGEAGIITHTDPDTVRGIDVAYFSFKRLPRGRESQGFTRIPPELAVEIIGKGQGWKKMVEKTGEYPAIGVDRVWVIDPQTRRPHIFRADAEPRSLGERDTLTDPDILPKFRHRVREIFKP